jgi:anti-anti-sigma regulatory factor
MLHETPRILRVPESLAASSPEFDRARLVVDLSGVDTLDAQFIAELALVHVHRRRKDLPLGRLVVDSQNLRNALIAVGFERYWQIYQTCEEAIRSFELR